VEEIPKPKILQKYINSTLG